MQFIEEQRIFSSAAKKLYWIRKTTTAMTATKLSRNS